MTEELAAALAVGRQCWHDLGNGRLLKTCSSWRRHNKSNREKRRREWLEIVEETVGMFTGGMDRDALVRLREDWSD